jgi:hypothetical protein
MLPVLNKQLAQNPSTTDFGEEEMHFKNIVYFEFVVSI